MTYQSHSSHIKGRLAEVKALSHFTEWGCEVAPVLGDNTSCDMVVLYDGMPLRVEVKSGVLRKGSKVPMATLGSKKTRSLPVDVGRFDLLAVYLDAEDTVMVWDSSVINVAYTWTVTDARREEALKGEADLVESANLARQRLAGLHERSDARVVPPPVITSSLLTAGHPMADSSL